MYLHVPILRVHTHKKKKSVRDLSNDANAKFLWVFLIFFIKAHVVGLC